MILEQGKYFTQNITLLEKYHKSLWEKVSMLKPSYDAKICYSPQGKTNLKIQIDNKKDIYLHDQNDPEKEIPLFLNMIPENSSGVILLTGMGLGYTPKAILENRKKIQYVVVFDLIPDIFLQALHHMDLASMLSDPRLILAIDFEHDINKTLAPASLALQLENIHNLKHLPSFSLDNESYTRLNEEVFSVANQYNLGGGAILGGGKAYTANRFANLPSMYRNNLLEALKGKFENIPAILVAGGPSLDMNIHHLSGLKDRAVIISVDSALPALVANGVSPDFMTAIDPYDLIYEKFADALPKIKETCLIASTWVAPKVPKIFAPDKVFWTFSGRNMENWMMEIMGGQIPTGGASTVAHLNLVAAILMGCSPIIFVGQDLAYSGKVSHAKNTSLTQNQAVNRLLKSNDILWTDEINGGKIPTDRKFLNFKRHFEYMIENHPGRYINSTVQGARIKGADPMDIEDVIDVYCSEKKNISQIISSIGSDNKTSADFIKEFRSFIKESKILFNEIEKANALQKKVIGTLKNEKSRGKIYKSFDQLNNMVKNQISSIDKSHKKIDKKKKIWGILDEMTMAGLQTSERQKHDIRKMAGDPKNYSEWLLMNIERFNQINSVRENELQTFTAYLSKLILYFEKEKQLIEAIDKQKKEHDLIALADFYFESNEFSLLDQICDNFQNNEKVPPQVLFYKGCLALLKNQFDLAQNRFEIAVEQAPDLKGKIRDFRFKFGDGYIGHADFFKGKDENTAIRMLIKGLEYSGSAHPILGKRLRAILEADLKKIRNAFDTGDPRTVLELVGKWIDDLEENKVLSKVLEKSKCGELYKSHAGIFVKEGRYDKGMESCNKALCFVDDNPEYYLLKADTCFAMNDFDNGVVALSQAVSLDRRYAQYWENMGDNLVKNGSFTDALAAYEQNLLAIPENRNILAKMAKCYLELGQVEAANEAMNQLKKSR